jgi:hypothetical protein
MYLAVGRGLSEAPTKMPEAEHAGRGQQESDGSHCVDSREASESRQWKGDNRSSLQILGINMS